MQKFERVPRTFGATKAVEASSVQSSAECICNGAEYGGGPRTSSWAVTVVEESSVRMVISSKRTPLSGSRQVTKHSLSSSSLCCPNAMRGSPVQTWLHMNRQTMPDFQSMVLGCAPNALRPKCPSSLTCTDMRCAWFGG